MSLKLKFALLFSLLVSAILLIGFTVIYYSYENFRQEEFYLRLEQKGLTTCRLLVDVREIDENLLQIIDRNTINELYDEKVLIFNDSLKLIYSSIDDHKVEYSINLLKQIKQQRKLEFTTGDKEILGLAVSEGLQSKIVIISAFDKFGKRKLKNLKYNMLFAGAIALLITSLLSYFFVNQFFKPIEILGKKIKAISGSNLKEEINLPSVQKEFINLAESFNQMLARIQTSINIQKNFVQNASHELRTPLANLVLQTQVALNKNLTVTEHTENLKILNQDLNSLVELSNALLILSEIEENNSQQNWTLIRLDEILYKSMEQTNMLYSNFKFEIDFETIPTNDNELLIKGNETLLQIALSNLLRNACQYSINNTVGIKLTFKNKQTIIAFTNNGSTLNATEAENLFTPFYRASNSANKSGSGLGLAIAKRIINLHHSSLNYNINSQNLNEFKVIFNKF